MADLALWEEEFRNLAAKESGFDACRDRYDASREKARTFQDLTSREKDKMDRLGEVERDLTRSREGEERLARDEGVISTLAPVIARRIAIQSRLKELGGLEERYLLLSAGIDKKEGTLLESRRQGRELRSRIERIRKEKEVLKALAAAAGVPPDMLDDPLGHLDLRRRDLVRTIADATALRDQGTLKIGDL